MINPTISEWLNFIARWIHVFAGIMWVGTTYYFTWLDARLTEEEKALLNTDKAAQIWMVHSGGFYVVEKRKVPDELSRKLHWFKWEAGTTWLSGFALLIIATAFGLTHVLSGRAVYIRIGAMFGTIMAANVWMRILPAQRKMIEAINAGKLPDAKLAAQAKLRSKQNTFMAVPVVFLMISSHFGGTTTGGYDWIHLAILIPVGWLAAKFIRRA